MSGLLPNPEVSVGMIGLALYVSSESGGAEFKHR